MADDLDKYLEGLGIDQGDARTPAAPKPAPASPVYEEPELESRPSPVAETAVQAGEVPSVTGSSPAERCESFLANLLLNLGPTYTAEVRSIEDGLQADISGGDSGKLIGRGADARGLGVFGERGCEQRRECGARAGLGRHRRLQGTS